jgi:2'-5' RNA ligase
MTPSELSEEIGAIQLRWRGKRSTSGAHLTLLPPCELLPWVTEEALLASMASVGSNASVFEVELTKVGYFGNKVNIHVRVEKTDKMMDCYQAIMNAIEGKLRPSTSEYCGLKNPHISIVSKLPLEIGEQAWQELEGKDFSPSFECTEVVLLGRDSGDTSWRETGRIPLKA